MSKHAHARAVAALVYALFAVTSAALGQRWAAHMWMIFAALAVMFMAMANREGGRK